MKILRYLCYVFLIFMLATMSGIALFGRMDTADFDEEAVIVLGAGIRGEQVTMILRYRLERAYAYWLDNPGALVVVAGGQGQGESISEAEAMRRYLVEKGIPDERIIKESGSTSTWENFTFSKEILDGLLPPEYRVAFVTNTFHIYRSYCTATEAGLFATHIHAPMQGYMIPTAYLREFAAVLKMWVMGI